MGIAAFALAACSGEPSSPHSGDILSICKLPHIPESEARLVTLRGQMQSTAHGVVLVDEACGGEMVLLETEVGGLDLTLCGEQDLSENFGCPVGATPNVAVLRGSLARSNDINLLTVEELVEIREIVHDGA